jgi:hypothetical protein
MKTFPRVRPQVEALEARWMPSTAQLSNGILNVWGTDAAETIRVTQAKNLLTVQGVGTFKAAEVQGVVVQAGAGNDYVDLRTLTMGATVYAGSGDDFVVGTQVADYLVGDDHNDRLFGLAGNDGIYGGSGNDLLFGANGYDYLYGQDGDDFLDDGNRAGQEYADPGAGQDWNADVVALGGTAYSDVQQRGAPTCGFLSTLSGLARQGYDFTKYISYVGNTSDGTPQYKVAFWQGSKWTWVTVNFNGTVTGKDTSPATEGESWVLLMQKAWIKHHGSSGKTWPHEAIFALTGKKAFSQHSVKDADFNRIASALQNKKVVLTATNGSPISSLVKDHAYTVLETWGTGSNLWVQVRNPWGYDGGTTTSGDANDGLIWLTWSEFKANMRYLAIA